MDTHTTQLSFIADKAAQLRECPGVKGCALRPSSLHPRANVRDEKSDPIEAAQHDRDFVVLRWRALATELKARAL